MCRWREVKAVSGCTNSRHVCTRAWILLNFTILILSWCYLSRSFPFTPIYRFPGAWSAAGCGDEKISRFTSAESTQPWARSRMVPLEPDIEAHINIHRILDNFHYFYRFPRTLQLTSTMPAPDITYRQIDPRPALGHVWAHIITHSNLSSSFSCRNLMVDTFIANASADEWVSSRRYLHPFLTLSRQPAINSTKSACDGSSGPSTSLHKCSTLSFTSNKLKSP